ncbi:hypothetical protein C8R44DRAFT_760602 [Mycena epipterygia]|nr:hypothetical protein C8R44DRAFT_760602 [Mycena epipterygia]
MTQVDIPPHITDWNAPIFNGHPHEDVRMWLCGIRYGLKQRRIPSALWVDVASHFLGEEPRAVLDNVERMLGQLESREGTYHWDWDTFTRALIHVHDQVKKDAADLENDSQSIGDNLRRFRTEHPYAAAAAGLGLVAVGGITVAPAILVGTLNVLGFSASGVVGGSIAAWIQSTVYGAAVSSGSLFSLAQSAAAGGIMVAPVAAQAVSTGAMALGAWFGFGGARGNGGNSAPAAIPVHDDDAPVSL